MSENLVSIRDLVITTDTGTELVHGVSIDVPRGSTIGIVGESGSGKSLTCRAILGDLDDGVSIGSGEVTYRGTDLTDLSPRGWRALWGAEIGAVFQDPASYLNPSIRIGAQVEESLRFVSGLGKREARLRSLELLRAVGLRDPERVSRQRVSQLSGGMLQRVLIAIAVSNNPSLLIADEPTTALDVTVQAEVLDLLRRLRDERDLTVVFVSHDLAVVAQVCDYLYVFRHGVVVEEGPTRAVFASPEHPYTAELVAHAREFGHVRPAELAQEAS